MRSICRKYDPNLLGRNEKQQAYADSYASTLYERFKGWFKPYICAFDWNSKKKKEEGTESAREYLSLIESCLDVDLGTVNDVTYTDFLIYWILEVITLYDSELVNSFYEIKNHMEYFKHMIFKKYKDKYAKSVSLSLVWPQKADQKHDPSKSEVNPSDVQMENNKLLQEAAINTKPKRNNPK